MGFGGAGFGIFGIAVIFGIDETDVAGTSDSPAALAMADSALGRLAPQSTHKSTRTELCLPH